MSRETRGEKRRLQDLMEQSILVDAESNLTRRFFEPRDGKPSGWDRIARTRLTAIQVTLGAYGAKPFAHENIIRDLAFWGYYFDVYRDFLLRVTRAEDLLVAKEKKKLGILMGLQNAAALEGDLSNLNIFYGLGIRLIQLTYNERNLVGDGCLERGNAGLTRFGIELIEKMNKLGMIIDLSHCGHRTTLEAIDASETPVMFSHTAAWSLCENLRNKLDEELVALAKKKGVVGVYAVPFWLTRKKRATLEDMLDHIDYLVHLVGVDHVGIGTDRPDSDPKEASRKIWETKWKSAHSIFELSDSLNIRWPPYTQGIEYITKWPNIILGLIRRGYGDEDIQKITGGNFYRLFKEVMG